MPNRPSDKAHENFSFRLRLGDQEVEIGGCQEDVMNTIRELPKIIIDIDKAFEKVRPKKVTTLTVKTEPPRPQNIAKQDYPKIPLSQTPGDALLNLLATDWGKWRPRTIDELNDALRTNGMETPLRTLNSVLMNLVKTEKIVRWHTNSGYVYILAEKEALQQKGEGLAE